MPSLRGDGGGRNGWREWRKEENGDWQRHRKKPRGQTAGLGSIRVLCRGDAKDACWGSFGIFPQSPYVSESAYDLDWRDCGRRHGASHGCSGDSGHESVLAGEVEAW